MYPRHQRTIQRMIARFQPDPAVLALIIIGSVDTGDARGQSAVGQRRGRLILSHNRMLYPNLKWFLREFERARLLRSTFKIPLED